MRNSENYMITTGSDPIATDDETTGPFRGLRRLRLVVAGAGHPFLIYGGNTLFFSTPPFFRR